MTRIVVNDTLRSLLHNLTHPLELCDASGRVLAHVSPVSDLSEYELIEPPIAEAEMQRRERSFRWHSSAEVLARLNRLEGQ